MTTNEVDFDEIAHNDLLAAFVSESEYRHFSSLSFDQKALLLSKWLKRIPPREQKAIAKVRSSLKKNKTEYAGHNIDWELLRYLIKQYLREIAPTLSTNTKVKKEYDLKVEQLRTRLKRQKEKANLQHLGSKYSTRLDIINMMIATLRNDELAKDKISLYAACDIIREILKPFESLNTGTIKNNYKKAKKNLYSAGFFRGTKPSKQPFPCHKNVPQSLKT